MGERIKLIVGLLTVGALTTACVAPPTSAVSTKREPAWTPAVHLDSFSVNDGPWYGVDLSKVCKEYQTKTITVGIGVSLLNPDKTKYDLIAEYIPAKLITNGTEVVLFNSPQTVERKGNLFGRYAQIDCNGIGTNSVSFNVDIANLTCDNPVNSKNQYVVYADSYYMKPDGQDITVQLDGTEELINGREILSVGKDVKQVVESRNESGTVYATKLDLQNTEVILNPDTEIDLNPKMEQLALQFKCK